MPSLFVSYARTDQEVVEQIAQELIDRGISVWRDQEKIHAGQRWPKALGEAIASNDFVLLIWSHNSAASEFVELEWSTAIALKKTILPCLIDETPLPPSLRAIHAIQAKKPENAISHIMAALSKEVQPIDATHSRVVIKRLGDITVQDPHKVFKAAKAIFDEHEWTVKGNVYQAAGNIVFTTTGTTHLEKANPHLVSAIVEWKRKNESDSTPRRWVVYVDNDSDAPITVEQVKVSSSSRKLSIEDWGTVRPKASSDYGLEESDFDPSDDRPEVYVRFLDSYGQRWTLRKGVLKRIG